MEKDNKKIIGDYLVGIATEDIESDLDSMLKADCVLETINSLEDGKQYAYNLMFLQYIYRLYSNFSDLGENNPRLLANIETDKLLDSFRNAIDIADRTFEKKAKEYGI